MSATNSTPIINLPLFIGSDKPAWLTDWNGAMNTIDTAIAALQTAEAGTATSLASLAQSVEALSGTVSQHTTAIQTVTTATAGNTGSINTINSLIGNGEPTTEDKTIIGAINELDSDLNAVSDRKYIKTFRSEIVNVTGDGVKTFAELMEELNTAFATYMANLDGLAVWVKELITGVTGVPILQTEALISKGAGRNIYFPYSEMSTNGTILEIYHCQHNLAGWRLVKNTLTDNTAPALVDLASSVVPSGTKMSIYADIID